MKHLFRTLLTFLLLVCLAGAATLWAAAAYTDVQVTDQEDVEDIKEISLDFERAYIKVDDKSNASPDSIRYATEQYWIDHPEKEAMSETSIDRYEYKGNHINAPHSDTSKWSYPEAAHALATGVGGNAGRALAFTYDPAVHTNAGYTAGYMTLMPAYFLSDNDNKTEANIEIRSYDYVSVSFDLWLENPQSIFFLGLENDENAYRMLLVTPDGKVWIRTVSGSLIDEQNDDRDTYLGTLDLTRWNTITIKYYLQSGTIGFYDYVVEFEDKDGQFCTGEASMLYLASQERNYNTSFNSHGTRLRFMMIAPETQPAARSVWALDNITFVTRGFTAEPETIEQSISAPVKHENFGYQTMWMSSDYGPDAVFGVEPGYTDINGAGALLLDGDPAARANDPANRHRGTAAAGDKTYTLTADALTVTGGSALRVPLTRAGGNTYLSDARIASDYRFSFKVYGDPALGYAVGDTALTAPALTAGAWNDVTITVEGGQASVNGAAASSVSGSEAYLTVSLPAAAVQLKDFRLEEKLHTVTWTQTIGGEEIAISAARANYLNYLLASRADASARALDYDTAEREGMRPVGDVQFDARNYMPTGTVSVNRWGTSINNASLNDVTFWGTNVTTIGTTEKVDVLDDNGDPVLDDDGNVVQEEVEITEERNEYLKGWLDLYMEDGAFVTRLKSVKDENGDGIEHTQTFGFQANLKQDQGVKEMKGERVTEYFRYRYSLWYDKDSFPDSGFTYYFAPPNASLKDADGNSTGLDGFTGQVVFMVAAIDRGEGIKPYLIMPNFRLGEYHGEYFVTEENPTGEVDLADTHRVENSYASISYAGGEMTRTTGMHDQLINIPYTQVSDFIFVELDEGWNTFEMEFKYIGCITSVEAEGYVEARKDPSETPSASAYDYVSLVDGETYKYIDIKNTNHYYFRTSFFVNGEYVCYDEDLTNENRTYFIMDSGINPCITNSYMQGNATLRSDGTETEVEEERIKVKDFALEFLTDEVIAVNCNERGTEGEDVIRAADFTLRASEVADDPKFAYPALTESTVGAVAYTRLNSRLVVDFEAAATARIAYEGLTEELPGDATFDFRIYLDRHTYAPDDETAAKFRSVAPDTIRVKADETTLFAIDAAGVVRVGSAIVADTVERGWTSFSAVLEKTDGGYLLTVYLEGEIILFREPIALTALSSFAIEADGAAGRAFRLDDLAVSASDIPTSRVFMSPVSYMFGPADSPAYNPDFSLTRMFAMKAEGGEPLYMTEDNRYHLIGIDDTTLPVFAGDQALADGWFSDEALTARVKKVKASQTTPVVLYTKYKYRLSYEVTGLQIQPVIGYGELALARRNNTSYWYATVDGEDVYVVPGGSYFLSGNVTFRPADATLGLDIDFILAVRAIDPEAKYADLFEQIAAADACYGEMDEEGNFVSYIVDTTSEKVIAANTELNALKAVLQDKKEKAEEYLAEYARLADKTRTYSERLASYNLMDGEGTEDPDGKTWRYRVDPTYPGIFEANDDLSTLYRTLERTREGAERLVAAVDAYKNVDPSASLSAKFKLMRELGAALTYCEQKLEPRLYETCVLEGLTQSLDEYKAEATRLKDAYNARSASVNAAVVDGYNAVASYNAGIYRANASTKQYNGSVPVAIYRLIDVLRQLLGLN
ncbi:MAG: hypothetical protein J6125_03840 [Clostridia bacterium]|nr:hypothetical protein [Clostridia bacterium]